MNIYSKSSYFIHDFAIHNRQLIELHMHTSYSAVLTVKEGTRENSSLSVFKMRGLVSQLNFGERAFQVERIQTTCETNFKSQYVIKLQLI
jgi:hypothetical protein